MVEIKEDGGKSAYQTVDLFNRKLLQRLSCLLGKSNVYNCVVFVPGSNPLVLTGGLAFCSGFWIPFGGTHHP